MLIHEPAKTYNFDKQLKIGHGHEAELDKYFVQSFHVKTVDMPLQRMGIDRILIGRRSGREFTVEYKADETACRTGNIFFETISIDKQNKKGWALNSLAQILVVYLPSKHIAYWLSMAQVKNHIGTWMQTYPSRAIPNRSGAFEYNTVGTLVPLTEFNKYAVSFKVE